MIKEMTPLSMTEVKEYLKEKPELTAFVKKFVSLENLTAKNLRKKLESLEIMQLNEKNISKIIDFLPEEKESLNKIAPEMNLNEDDTNKILQTIKEYI